MASVVGRSRARAKASVRGWVSGACKWPEAQRAVTAEVVRTLLVKVSVSVSSILSLLRGEIRGFSQVAQRREGPRTGRGGRILGGGTSVHSNGTATAPSFSVCRTLGSLRQMRMSENLEYFGNRIFCRLEGNNFTEKSQNQLDGMFPPRHRSRTLRYKKLQKLWRARPHRFPATRIIGARLGSLPWSQPPALANQRSGSPWREQGLPDGCWALPARFSPASRIVVE